MIREKSKNRQKVRNNFVCSPLPGGDTVLVLSQECHTRVSRSPLTQSSGQSSTPEATKISRIVKILSGGTAIGSKSGVNYKG